MKKRYLILCISILGIMAIVTFLLLNNKKLFLKEDTILDNVPVLSDEEIIDITNEIISDKDNSNIESESIAETKDSTEQIQTSNKKQEIIASTEEKDNVKNENKKQLKESSNEIIVSNTKEETSTIDTTSKQETTPKQEITQTDSNNNTKNDTQSNTTSKDELPSSEPVDTIKRISAEELKAEKAKYLKDIQSINSNLKYKEAKRGQVFWPYRTSEIEVAIGSVTFGTVYYYVDVFVEGNQEKFKYYIDWTGEQ